MMTVMVSCSLVELPLVGDTVTQVADSLRLYVRVPVPLFQISKVVDPVAPAATEPKSCEVGVYDRAGVGGAEIP
jgi:hypothetical protein